MYSSFDPQQRARPPAVRVRGRRDRRDRVAVGDAARRHRAGRGPGARAPPSIRASGILAGNLVFLAVLAVRPQGIVGAGGARMTGPGGRRPTATGRPTSGSTRSRRPAGPSQPRRPGGRRRACAALPAARRRRDDVHARGRVHAARHGLDVEPAGGLRRPRVDRPAGVHRPRRVHGPDPRPGGRRRPTSRCPFAALVCAARRAPDVSWFLFRLRGGYFAIATWVSPTPSGSWSRRVPSLGGGTGADPAGHGRASTRSRASPGRTGSRWRSRSSRSRRPTGSSSRAARPGPHGHPRQRGRGARASAPTCGSAKRIVFLVAAAGCGAAGSLLILSQLNVQAASVFSVGWSAKIIFIVVIGGIGSIEGPILGTILYFALQQALAQYGAWYFVVLGPRRDRDRPVGAARAVGADRGPHSTSARSPSATGSGRAGDSGRRRANRGAAAGGGMSDGPSRDDREAAAGGRRRLDPLRRGTRRRSTRRTATPAYAATRLRAPEQPARPAAPGAHRGHRARSSGPAASTPRDADLTRPARRRADRRADHRPRAGRRLGRPARPEQPGRGVAGQRGGPLPPRLATGTPRPSTRTSTASGGR